MRRIVFDHFDIADQSGASIRTFHQIVAEQSVARKAAVKHLVQRIYLIDPLADKNAFPIQVLIHIRRRMRVDIQSRLP